LSTVKAQKVYYVSASGSDANTGLSEQAPFQSLTRLNALSLQAGDQILFRRGDVFAGSLSIRYSGSASSPITLDAYGTGAKPKLVGSRPITNWSSLGNNRWQATCEACGSQLTGLFLNNQALPLGRYPNASEANKGYLTIQSHQGKSLINSQQSLPANFTGGEVVIRPVQWILNRATITQQSGNSLSIAYSSGYEPADKWGYFIQNHPATLDQAGEWCYTASSKTIQLYSEQDPNNQPIRAAVDEQGLSLVGVSNVSVRNLQISQSLNTGLAVSNSSNVVLSGVEITSSGEDGVVVSGSGSGLLIENSLIEEANNNGVVIGAYQNVTFRGNTLRRIGLLAGRGRSGDGTYTGFASASTANTLIENNVVDQIGYNGINFSSGTVLQRNVVSNYCLTKSDGGGMYIWNGNKQALSGIRLVSNVVYNGIGASEGSPGGSYSGANGIYLDDCTANIELANNAVFNCKGLGIYLHGSSGVKVTNNTLYNNGEAQLAIMDIPGACSPRDNTVTGNVLVSRTADQFVNKYESHQNDLSSYGVFDNNVYARPYSDAQKVFVVYNAGSGIVGESLSLSSWQGRYGKDANSRNSPVSLSSSQSADEWLKLVYNAGGSERVESLAGSYVDVGSGKLYSGSVSVPAFSALVLVKKNVESPVEVALREPENPAYTVAGLDFSYYEGNWSALPNFDALTATKSGNVNSADLSVRNRDNQYAVRYKGYINVPANGQYTFYTSSDDGSKLYIGNSEVVNNDGLHAEQERSGTIGLKAGKHAITVAYLQGGGGQTLNLSYSGPGIGKQAIPASMFFRVGTAQQALAVSGTGSGLQAEYFNNINLTAPVVLTRTDATVNFDFGTGSPAAGTVNVDNFSARWTGQVQAPVTGNYTFGTTSDDGVRLWVNGNQVINNWTGHAPTTNNSASILLTANQKYDIRVEYYESGGGAVAKLLWAYPGQSQQVIPQERLYPATASTGDPRPPLNTGNAIYLSDLTWKTMTNGYGPAEKDLSNGESGSGDGRALKLNGVAYAKGLGVHAASEITYNLAGRYSNFITDIGIDDEIADGACGSLEFQVYLDNVLVYSSGTMTPTTATKSVNLNVSGKQTLKLVVNNLGDACGDHGDWAGARLTETGSGRVAAIDERIPDGLLQVDIYPMPARDEVNVQYLAKIAGEAVIQLTNIAGLPVAQLTHQLTEGDNTIKLPVHTLSRGVYVLTFIQGRQRITRKVILAE
jgi:parallel beta-helix repeat protein